MTDRSDVHFARGLDLFEAVIGRLGPDDWEHPSPCAGWTALDVLGHLGTSLDMGTSVLRGEQPTWPEFDRPADLVDGDPVEWWQAKATAARGALDDADLDLEMDTPMGPRTVADRLAFPAIDLFVHAWDIGRAADIDVEIPDDAIAFAHTTLDPFPDDVMRGPNGSLGAEVAAPVDATPTEAFIAWTGRQPR